MVAIFLKKFHVYKRNINGFLVEVLLPVVMVLVGLGLSKVTFFYDSPERSLDLSILPTPQRLILNSETQAASTFAPQDFISQLSQQHLLQSEEVEGFTLADYGNNGTEMI